MIDGYKTGFVTDPQGNRLLPITHINLVVDNDGRPISSIINQLDKRVFNVSTYEQMLSLNINNLMNGAICFVDDLETYYSYTTSNGWEVMTTSGNGSSSGGQIEDIYSHIWIGPDPPEDDKDGKILWLDTNEDGIVEGEDDLNLLYSLRDKINEMQTEIEVLNSRVKYLEENGVVVGPDPGPGPGTDTDEDDIILLEDGSSLLLENGSNLLLEVQEIKPKPELTNNLLFEDGIEILLEDGSSLLLEDGSTGGIIEDSIEINYEIAVETLNLSSESLLQVNNKNLTINSNKTSVLNNTLIL